MIEYRIENLHVNTEEPIITPLDLKKQLPLTEKVVQTVMSGQKTVKNILDRKDKRLFVIVGPCSIHDIKAAKEYADKLKILADELADTLFVVMRIYFEKPRTTIGWQGFINDPYLDNSYDIEAGLKMARQLLLYAGEIGLPAAGEALDIITPQYIQDLFSWTAIGARTTESQSHRKMASGFSTAVGFKNSTNGDLNIAVNAIISAGMKHNFVSVDPEGRVAVIRTKGNPFTHIILRGGISPNYGENAVSACEYNLKTAGINTRIMIDCSHDNSGKDPGNQEIVLENIASQIRNGNNSIRGLMLESNLKWGSQPLVVPEQLNYGVSITDACMDWETTEFALRKFRDRVMDSLPPAK